MVHHILSPARAPVVARKGSTVLGRLLIDHLKPYWHYLTAVLVLQVIASIASLTMPNLQADIINDGVSLGNTHYIWTRGAAMLLVSAVQLGCQIGSAYVGARAAMGLGRDLRAQLFDKGLSFSSQEVNQFGAPSLITRNTNDVLQVQSLVLMGCVFIVSAPITAVGGVFMALRQDLGLSWIILAVVIVLAIAIGVLLTRLLPAFRENQKRIDNMNRVMREQTTGVRVIRAFVSEIRERNRFRGANADLRDIGIRIGTLFAVAFPIVNMVMNSSSVAVMWFGAVRVNNGDMQMGNVTAFLTYLMQILMSVMMATMMMIMIPRAQVCAGRVQEVLNTQSSVVPPENPITPADGVWSQVELRGVEFSYPKAEQPVLHDISFTMSPGKTTAIIGATGSGKTTLINLIPRLYDATKGQVLVDGVDVRDLDQDLLWSKVGLVPQRPYLFTGTIASNLELGRPDASDEDMWGALRIAQADEFVRAMDAQLEAPISQGGTNVSGGQRQRLAIARALIKMPEVFIFDDAFSALDVATDANLRAALTQNIGTAAVLIVAQRVSSISHADQILVLEQGRIVGRGTHDELLRTCQTYKEIVESQIRDEDVALSMGQGAAK